MSEVTCPYCNAAARLADSYEVYGRSYGPIWICSNYPECDAYVGCHKGTNVPLGRLADRALRAYKKAAHARFDPLWREAPRIYQLSGDKQERAKAQRVIRQRARARTYAWLANQLGITPDECHIGMFDCDTCQRVIDICKTADPKQIREWAKKQEAA